jgi:hypothetical protein
MLKAARREVTCGVLSTSCVVLTPQPGKRSLHDRLNSCCWQIVAASYDCFFSHVGILCKAFTQIFSHRLLKRSRTISVLLSVAYQDQ